MMNLCISVRSVLFVFNNDVDGTRMTRIWRMGADNESLYICSNCVFCVQ